MKEWRLLLERRQAQTECVDGLDDVAAEEEVPQERMEIWTDPGSQSV